MMIQKSLLKLTGDQTCLVRKLKTSRDTWLSCITHDLKIPPYLLKDSVAVQLIGFADASAQASGMPIRKSENANETQISSAAKLASPHSRLCQYLGLNYGFCDIVAEIDLKDC
ncbi:hypothetical protein TNCT_261441 [Trichonephila clavata]|uniref:Uncharacterized protein n=1 Tax=Trichonephila clavata TaxID=2740835 RepID=A0A8X6M054_TRICU|nr:hypothetical protein TNCT_261441 [Trichonephila clavata]